MFYAPFDVVFSRFDAVEPDLLCLSNARAADVLTDKPVAGVPAHAALSRASYECATL